jgi:hypothetical protein
MEHTEPTPRERHLEWQLERYKQWAADLQSGLYVNCVYCGHRYPPSNTPNVADALKRHIAHCEEHPMSGMRKALAAVVLALETVHYDPSMLENQTVDAMIEISLLRAHKILEETEAEEPLDVT